MAAISGLYQSAEAGEKAARALREGGFAQAVVRPLGEINLGLLPTTPQNLEKGLVKGILAIPVGFVLLAPLGILVGLIAGAFPGVVAGFFFGAIGGAIMLTLLDRPPKLYRDFAKAGGVLLTVPCTRETRDRIVALLEGTKPAEVFIPTRSAE